MAYSLARRVSAQRIFERRYQMSYDWFVASEHINVPREIVEECGDPLPRRPPAPLPADRAADPAEPRDRP